MQDIRSVRFACLLVRKMTDYYNALDEHEFSEDMPEYQAIVNY